MPGKLDLPRHWVWRPYSPGCGASLSRPFEHPGPVGVLFPTRYYVYGRIRRRARYNTSIRISISDDRPEPSPRSFASASGKDWPAGHVSAEALGVLGYERYVAVRFGLITSYNALTRDDPGDACLLSIERACLIHNECSWRMLGTRSRQLISAGRACSCPSLSLICAGALFLNERTPGSFGLLSVQLGQREVGIAALQHTRWVNPTGNERAKPQSSSLANEAEDGMLRRSNLSTLCMWEI
ncbi:hypothetical protein GGS23DRAFT_585008 [Durotheca rogersii]|uniref:uncharacterized protein n=1 Tax=Durotheca rogersii TaxID=419775 RepID=UPI00221ECA5E|nr:uncharacterized protein GGS23DRAFT_585008 [Durotheca rogersii]KAI5859570.1 hypothetical protein GGS23DRAFT_585008 [Durotheca rogersii]